MIVTTLYFVFALALLIAIHEFGHFIVARWCGVKVLRFSLGFGKVLARRYDKRGTEFALSLIPLGGYVKMLDEAEGEVPAEESHLAFNRKSVWVRIAIVFAGPFFNFLFAFVALWLVWLIGIKSLAPIVESVEPGSVAYRAGLEAHQEIVALNGHAVASWRDFQYALFPVLGSNRPIELKVKSSSGRVKQVTLPSGHLNLDAKKPDILGSLGITPFVPVVPPVIGEVVPDSPADIAGLLPEDEIITLNGEPLTDWLALVDFVRQHPGEKIQLMVRRQAELRTIEAHIGRQGQGEHLEGILGVRSKRIDWPENWFRVQREGPLNAAGRAFEQTLSLTGATFVLIGRLVVGKLPLHSISGPVGIAQGAGQSGRSGLTYYLSFLALVSVSLGVLNLLPIPMLDGGHLLYYAVELVRRRPLSERAKLAGMYVGLVFLLALMTLGLGNDLVRLVG